MEIRENRVYTIEDIYALPNGERAELIDGDIYYMAAPGTRHQRLVAMFTREIGNYIAAQNGKCEVFPAPVAVFLNADEKTYLEPDIVVICDPDKITEKGCNGAPDWVVEIVSPSSKYMDYLRKLMLYQAAGVREYWIVDPDREQVVVYHFEAETMEQYPFGESVPVGIWEGELGIKVE